MTTWIFNFYNILMSIRKFLNVLQPHNIVKQAANFDRNTCVPFTGSLRKHPFDSAKLLLLTAPLTSHTQFLEFSFGDIAGIEEEPNLGSDTGESVTMVKIWVRKGSFGLQYKPFEVDSPIRFLKDTEIIHYAALPAEGDDAN